MCILVDCLNFIDTFCCTTVVMALQMGGKLGRSSFMKFHLIADVPTFKVLTMKVATFVIGHMGNVFTQKMYVAKIYF